MSIDDRYDDLVASLVGFTRAWLTYVGLELGLFERLRGSGRTGMTPGELAAAVPAHLPAVEAWASAADAHELVTLEGGRLVVEPDLAAILLDEDRPEHLGGQFVHAVVSTLDWDGLVEFFRTGRPIRSRPDRYRAAIERLTMQDIAVFFEELLSAQPQLVADLDRGARVLDVHCGGGRWLAAVAKQFPRVRGVGVEFEPDSVARARATIEAAGLADRVAIEQGDVAAPGHAGEFDLAYFQYTLHAISGPSAALAAAWSALRAGGRLLVLDWPLPSTQDEWRSAYGQLIAGVHLDELYQGTGLAPREIVLDWFTAAGLSAPEVLELPSGATAWLLARPV